jgi:ABC-2 type transport system ATP-binding protein
LNGNIDSVNSDATIQVVDVSKWYGSVVAVNDVSFDIGPGITGLLGPNGAGKTTLLHLISGLAGCSRGDITMLGEPVRDNPDLYRRMGFMPEHESTYNFYTGRQLVEFSAKLNNLSPMNDYVDRAISIVGLEDAQDRKMGTYSRGMKQRMRLAATLVHDPQVIILDEPLNGTDPRQRIEFQDVMERLANEGRAILISSHILEEVETLASRILLMISGKLAAAGDFRAIRAKLDEQAYKVRVVVDSPRLMASAIVGMEDVDTVSVSDDGSLIVYSRNVAALQGSLASLARDNSVRLMRVEPLDDSLESLFEYVVEA